MIKIDHYAIDAALSEDHDLEAAVTEFPVEEGAAVTDHVRLKPRTVTIKGIVTNTPIGAVADFRGGSNLLPTEEALVVLEAIYEAKEEVTIETSLKTYDRMVLEKLSIPRDGSTGDALMFTATFRQVTIESNKRVVIRAVPIAQKKKSLGLLNGRPPNWISTDAKGRKVFGSTLTPGVEPIYTLEDGTPLSGEEAAAASRREGKVLVKYDKDGHAVPISQRDYQPYTPKQKTPSWAPVTRK